MKSIRLLVAAAAVATVVAPAAANAGIRCTLYWNEHRVGPVVAHTPDCAW